MTDKKVDKAKGRVKEAAGALTGDRPSRTKVASTKPKAPQRKPSTRLATPSPAATRSRRTRVHSTRPTRTPGR
jgi:hypothetical protein